MKQIIPLIIAYAAAFAAGFGGLALLRYFLKKRGKKIRLFAYIALSLLLSLTLCLGATAVYLSIHYSPDAAAEKALKGSDRVEVTHIDGAYFFDGPSDDAALVFYPGAKVDAEAYAPLLSRLAEDGIDCFLLEMPFRLAILDTNAADKVLDKYDYGCVMVSGHSMGGVAASNYAAEHGNVDGLVLLTSYPSKEIGGSVSVLSIYGSRDGVLDSGAYSSAKSKLPDNSAELVIEGGNHAQFGNYGKQFGDNDADISAEEQQRQTAEAILALKIRIA